MRYANHRPCPTNTYDAVNYNIIQSLVVCAASEDCCECPQEQHDWIDFLRDYCSRDTRQALTIFVFFSRHRKVHRIVICFFFGAVHDGFGQRALFENFKLKRVIKIWNPVSRSILFYRVHVRTENVISKQETIEELQKHYKMCPTCLRLKINNCTHKQWL